MPGLTAALLAAYHRTEYRVGDAVIRIGGRSPGADAALRRLGAGEAALVTAHNPRSERTAPHRNARRQRRLMALTAGLPRLDAVAAPGTRWEEPMLLLGVAPHVAARLGRRFGQHAVVALRAGGPVCLLWGRVGG